MNVHILKVYQLKGQYPQEQINEIYNLDLNYVKNFVFNPTFKTKIIRPKLGDSAGVYGAAYL